MELALRNLVTEVRTTLELAERETPVDIRRSSCRDEPRVPAIDGD